jgi:2-methylcitrate dehydratase PrpD
MNAFGLAAMCAPIPYLGRWERTPPANRAMTKYEFYGPLTANGVRAAFLAKEGFIGDKDALDGDIGFWRLYGAKAWKSDSLVNDLGTKWWINDTSFKAVPGCRHISAAVDLFERISRQERLHPDEIDSITVRANSVLAERGFGCFPENEVDMLFSVPYLLAVAGVENFRAGPDWVHTERLDDPRVRALAAKVHLEINPKTSAAIKDQLESDGVYKRVPTELEVIARGSRFIVNTDFATGDPWTPESRMTDEHLANKFRSMCRHRLDPSQIDLAIDKIKTLENAIDLTEIFHHLTPGDSPVDAGRREPRNSHARSDNVARTK